MNVVTYIRVSTREQGESGLGLDAQTMAIDRYCQERGHAIIGGYEDVDSGAKRDRRSFQDAMAILRKGEADALVVARLDRLTRSLAHFAQIMEQSRREGWALIALDLGVDTTTAAGGMIANVLASFAEYERLLIGERIRDALAAKKAADPDSLKRPHRSVPDAVRGRIRELRVDGWTLQQIASLLREAGVETAQGGAWRPSTVAYLLKGA